MEKAYIFFCISDIQNKGLWHGYETDREIADVIDFVKKNGSKNIKVVLAVTKKVAKIYSGSQMKMKVRQLLLSRFKQLQENKKINVLPEVDFLPIDIGNVNHYLDVMYEYLYKHDSQRGTVVAAPLKALALWVCNHVKRTRRKFLNLWTEPFY